MGKPTADQAHRAACSDVPVGVIMSEDAHAAAKAAARHDCTYFYRKLRIVDMRKVRGTEPESAVRAYKGSPDGWALQVRGLLAKANGQPSSVFIIAHANLDRADLAALHEATCALVAEADNLVRIHVYERRDDEYHASVAGTNGRVWERGRTPDAAIRALLNRKEYAGRTPVVSFGYLGATA